MQVKELRKLLQRLTPLNATNEQAVQFVAAHADDHAAVLDALLAEFNRSSLNARARILFFLEHCCGGVGGLSAPQVFLADVAASVARIVALGVPEHMYPACLANVACTQHFVDSLASAKLVSPSVARQVVAEHAAAVRRRGEALDESAKVYTNREEVLRRIEEDRERHKKYKERERTRPIGSIAEFEAEWETAHMSKKDRRRIAAINALRA